MKNLLICLGNINDYINAYSILINNDNSKIMIINNKDNLIKSLQESEITTSNEVQIFDEKNNYTKYLTKIDYLLIFGNDYYVIHFLKKIKKYNKKIIKIGPNDGIYKNLFKRYINYFLVHNEFEKKEIDNQNEYKSKVFVINNIKFDLIDKKNNRYENSLLVFVKNENNKLEIQKLEEEHKYITFIYKYYDFEYSTIDNYKEIIDEIKKNRYVICDNDDIKYECEFLRKKIIHYNKNTIKSKLSEIKNNYLDNRQINYQRTENWKQLNFLISINFIKIYCERWVVEDSLVNKNKVYNFLAEFERNYNINTGEYLIGWASRNLFYDYIIEYDFKQLDINNDIILIFASNIFTKSNDLNNKYWHDKFLNFKKKFIIGCGTQINNIFEDKKILDDFDPGENTIKLFKSIKNTIPIRGNITEYLMKKFEIDCKVLGCPTLLSLIKNYTKTYKICKISKKNIKKVLISPTIYSNKENTESVLDFANLNNNDIILCTEKTLYKMKKNKDNNIDNYKNISDYNIHYKYKDLLKVLIDNSNIKIFFPKDFKEYFEILNNYDFLISTRIHCCIINISLGRPTLCIVHDSRTFELCQTMNIPFVVEFNKDCKLETLIECYNNQVERYNKNIMVYLNNYIKFFNDNKIPIKKL